MWLVRQEIGFRLFRQNFEYYIELALAFYEIFVGKLCALYFEYYFANKLLLVVALNTILHN